MPSTGQPSSNRSLVGNTRYAGVGNPFVPGNRIPSPAMRNSLVDRQEAQSILKTTDQLGLGDGVMVSVDHLTNVATGALKNVVPDVLNQLRDLGASASKLLSGASSRMAGTSAAVPIRVRRRAPRQVECSAHGRLRFPEMVAGFWHRLLIKPGSRRTQSPSHKRPPVRRRRAAGLSTPIPTRPRSPGRRA